MIGLARFPLFMSFSITDKLFKYIVMIGDNTALVISSTLTEDQLRNLLSLTSIVSFQTS